MCDGLGVCQLAAGGVECAPYACAAGGCATPCVSQADCVAGAFCESGVCELKGASGDACAGDPVHLGLLRGGGVLRHHVRRRLPVVHRRREGRGLDGTCGLAAAGADPHDDCLDDAAPSCQRDGVCDGMGACQLYPLGTQCAATSCLGNAPVAFACNGAGTCVADSGAAGCAPFSCADGACTTSCLTADDCGPSAYCEAGACLAKLGGAAQVCKGGGDCVSGLCVDGYCCNDACEGQCEACDVPGGEGLCVPVSGAPQGPAAGLRSPALPGSLAPPAPATGPRGRPARGSPAPPSCAARRAAPRAWPRWRRAATAPACPGARIHQLVPVRPLRVRGGQLQDQLRRQRRLRRRPSLRRRAVRAGGQLQRGSPSRARMAAPSTARPFAATATAPARPSAPRSTTA